MLRTPSRYVALAAARQPAVSIFARGIFSREPPSRPPPAYPGHIPLNWFENVFLAAGSAVVGLTDLRRGGETNVLGNYSLSPNALLQT